MSDNITVAESNKMEKDEQPAVQLTPEYAKDTGAKWVPQFASDSLHWAGAKVEKVRKKSIEVTPAFVVNNSSNILASMHIGTEMMMFKSAMGEKPLVKDKSRLTNWVIQPVEQLWDDINTRSRSQDYKLKELFTGNVAKNTQDWLNPHNATIRAIGREKSLRPNGIELKPEEYKILKIGSPWQTRTTLAGLVIWSLSAVIPERKESDEQIEKMAQMRTLHPFQYVGTRLKQAVWFPEWHHHKREMLGLGYLSIGVLSGIGSWFNRAALINVPKEIENTFKGNKKALKDFMDKPENVKTLLDKKVADFKELEAQGKAIGAEFKQLKKDVQLIKAGIAKGHLLRQRYSFNKGYLFTSAVSFVAGLPLLFALDERKAYSTYGSMSVLRLPGLYSSISQKMNSGEAGWQYYAGSKLSFQVEDGLFSLIGGATKKKRPDGTYEIIDHEALKKKAVTEAREEKLDRKEEKIKSERTELVSELQGPRTRVSSITKPERLMADSKQLILA